MGFVEHDLRWLLPGSPELNAGHGVRAKKNKDGSVTFILQWRLKGSKPIRKKIGKWPEMSIEEAQDKAKTWRNGMALGIHPKDQDKHRTQIQNNFKSNSKAGPITLYQLLEEFEESRKTLGKVNTQSTVKDRRYTICSAYEDWLEKPIEDITQESLWNRYLELASAEKRTLGQAKKASRYLKSLLNYAVNQKNYIRRNPCSVFKSKDLLTPNRRKDFLTQSECVELLDWIGLLTQEPPSEFVFCEPYNLHKSEASGNKRVMFFAIVLFLFTGLKKRELLKLEWKNVHLEAWENENLSGPYFCTVSTETNAEIGIPITPEMEAVFSKLKNDQINRFVFPSPRPGTNLEAPIDNERAAYLTLGKLMPNTEKTKKFTANLLQNSFTNLSYQLGYSKEQASLLTGHSRQEFNPDLTTKARSRLQAESHRFAFEHINKAIIGRAKIMEVNSAAE
ncbi:MAG: integrase family protein [Pseudomonadota bacterium]|nr:integrase family protein [Pseudomonadota bacterium]